MNEETKPSRPDADSGAEKAHGSDSKSRPIHDTTLSEATRELRDTSRRRRDAEEKLQQHLMEAKDHVPNDHTAHHDEANQDDEDRHGRASHENSSHENAKREK